MRSIKDLREYQNFCVEHITKSSHCGLFLEMGLGKTVSTLTAFNRLAFEDLDIETALVVAPKRVAESVWADEVKNWSHLNHLRVSIISGSEKQRLSAIREPADIYTISRDNIAWLCGQYGGSGLPFGMLIIDELSSFKNPQSLRFKALRAVQPSFKRVVGLTGTPAPNGLIDLWSQLYLLDRGERLGKTISKYRSEYFKPGKQNGYVVYSYNLKDGAEEGIHNRIGDICVSMKSKDYLTLPPRIDNVIKLEMPPDIKKKYVDFEKEKVLSLYSQLEGNKEVAALNAAALSNKLAQFANGAVYDDEKNWHAVHDLKLDAMAEVVEALNGNPLLVAWSFRSDRDRILKRFIAEGARELKTDKDIKDWNAGKIPILILHPASGGHGLNLQFGGHTALWFGSTWSAELEQQFNARLHRSGVKEAVTVHRLVVAGTIDEDIAKAVEAKALGQDALMEAIKARKSKYLGNC